MVLEVLSQHPEAFLKIVTTSQFHIFNVGKCGGGEADAARKASGKLQLRREDCVKTDVRQRSMTSGGKRVPIGSSGKGQAVVLLLVCLTTFMNQL